MKGRSVILDEIGDRQCAALLVDGRIEELSIDPDGDVVLPGAIFRAVADRPMKGRRVITHSNYSITRYSTFRSN